MGVYLMQRGKHHRAPPKAKSRKELKMLTESFRGPNRSEQADEFVAKIEAMGGTVYDRYADELAEGPGGWFTVVDYELPEEVDEDEE